MPPARAELDRPMGLGHGRTEYAQMTKGMDHIAQGVATATPLGDAAIHFGMGHSCFRKKHGARRERFKERMVDLVANPPTDDVEGELERT